MYRFIEQAQFVHIPKDMGSQCLPFKRAIRPEKVSAKGQSQGIVAWPAWFDDLARGGIRIPLS